MAHSPAIELLHALLGDADQKTVVPVRVVGMPFKVRANRLDASFDILGQLDPVAFFHEASRVRLGNMRPDKIPRNGRGRLEDLCTKGPRSLSRRC
ncbi:hypothetical protein [Pseudomonas sp. S11A4]|uniref:hypothetical protein n=1 Tax=Pseudomonas sp. S11A4 TaxID=1476791 RepID=UPI00215B9A2F|nr:hypothetical protein [Pseudomonas sp. S11A4]